MTRNTRVSLTRLREEYHLASYAGTNRVGRMVQLYRVRDCYSDVASVD